MTAVTSNRGISGSGLKIIAIISMLIDHFGLAIWNRLPGMGYLVPEVMTVETWYFIYRCMRNIGRTAFPIFCFLLVEGFFWTSDRRKYVIRLLVFAFLSEIPFKLAFSEFGVGTNVFFTLLFGLAAITAMEEAKKRIDNGTAALAARLFMLGLAGYAAVLLRTDYDWRGVMLIGIIYFFRKNKLLSLGLGYLSFVWEAFCLPGFVLLWFYNGKRGMRIKYLFYIIYPLHLLVLYVIWQYLLQ